jgi:hypothetical protein
LGEGASRNKRECGKREENTTTDHAVTIASQGTIRLAEHNRTRFHLDWMSL